MVEKQVSLDVLLSFCFLIKIGTGIVFNHTILEIKLQILVI